MAVLELDCSPGERVLLSALNHFDRIYSQPDFQSLMQQEMVRLRKGETNALSPLIEKLFGPMGQRFMAVAEEGIRSGELIQVEPSQVIYAALGPNVFYFLSAPMMGLFTDANVLGPAALAFRRRVAIEFLGQSLFTDRARGAAVATRVLDAIPMPPIPAYGIAGQPIAISAQSAELMSRKTSGNAAGANGPIAQQRNTAGTAKAESEPSPGRGQAISKATKRLQTK
jgi:hypothetical protein